MVIEIVKNPKKINQMNRADMHNFCNNLNSSIL